MNQLPFSVNDAGYFFLVFVRVISILALVPIFGTQMVLPQVKIALGLIFTILLCSSIMPRAVPFQPQLSLPQFMLLVIKEAMVGIAVGFTGSLLFTAVQFAGRLVDTEMGFGYVELIDPTTSETVTVWGQLQVAVFTVLFLLFNGHYFLLLAIQRSFELIPLMGAVLPGG